MVKLNVRKELIMQKEKSVDMIRAIGVASTASRRNVFPGRPRRKERYIIPPGNEGNSCDILFSITGSIFF